MAKRICVVGAGRWGKNHIKTLESLGWLAGIVETREETLRWFREKHPGVQTFASVSDSLSANFDGYTIATPAETHLEIAELLLKNKKPILVEKPLALKASEAAYLRDLAHTNKVPLMVGHVMLFHPAIRKMKELIDGGKVGKLQYIYSNRLNLGTVRTEENILWSFAPHDISIFQYFIGRQPLEVVSRGGAFVQSHLHDTTMTVLKYPDNAVGHIFVSWLHPFKEHRLVVIGSKGMLSYEDSSAEKELVFFEKGIDWVKGEPVSRDGPTEVIPFEKLQPLTEEMKAFGASIDSGEATIACGRNGVEVLEILERASADLLATKMSEGSEAPVVSSEIKSDKKVEKKDESFFVHSTSFVDENVQIGDGTKIWHFSHVQSGSIIGKKVAIGQNVNVGNNVRIGNFVKIQNNVSVYEGVELEDYVFCGPSMVFTNVHDPRSKYPQRGTEFYRRTLVREGASIGANATIVCGNMVGKHAFIGAGSVVTKDVPDYAIMVGNPARQIGWMCECGQKLARVDEQVNCGRCKLEYTLKAGRLVAVAADLPQRKAAAAGA